LLPELPFDDTLLDTGPCQSPLAVGLLQGLVMIGHVE